MVRTFEQVVSTAKKEPLSWTVYAHCLLSRGQKDEAVKVLERAKKVHPDDPRLLANLEAAQEGKKLKTAPYGDKWTRFRLDGEGAPMPAWVPKEARGFASRPGFRQRPKRPK